VSSKRAYGQGANKPPNQSVIACILCLGLLLPATLRAQVPPPNGPGRALSFNGEFDYVDLPDEVWFSGDFTMEGPFNYSLASKDALHPAVPWSPVPNSARTGTGTILTVPDTRPRSPTNRFYRALMTP
jgi:hypothetical protein